MNFYSVEDVKAMLKISEGTLYRYIKEGKIPAATSKTAKAETAEAGDAGTAEAPAETADAEAPKA